MALAQHLLEQLSLPPGTKTARVKSLPPLLRDLQGPSAGWVSAQRILVAPGQPRAVWELLLAHAPFNQPTRFGVVPTSTSMLLPAPEPGVDAAEVDVSMASLSPTTTLVAAYARTAWLPARTAAEHLDPAGFRAVTVSADQLVPRSHRVTRTFTSAVVIAQLAAFLNKRPPAPGAVLAAVSCPAPLVSFTVQFTARGTRASAVTVSTDSCMLDTITVDGEPQPSLWDTQGGLAALARKLLGLL
jgi:hypothetical protein